MSNNFFDEKVLAEIVEKYDVIKGYDDLSYNFSQIDGIDYFYCKIGEERLNCLELKAILRLNEKKSILAKEDVFILDYVTHRLSETQAYYKILNDFDLFFSHLKDTKFAVFAWENKISFGKIDYKLTFDFDFNSQGSIKMRVLDDGKFIFGQDKVFFMKGNVIYSLSDVVSLDFYRQISEKFKDFTVDSFFLLQKNYWNKLKSVHLLTVTKEVDNLANLNLEEKVAPLVLSVDKTAHFIALELKYKIGEKTFNVSDYKYADTINWLDKTNLICVLKEGDRLVKYISDENLSEDIFEEMFDGSRIWYRQYVKTPFRLMLPIFQLNNFVTRVIPRAEKIVEVDYRGGQKLKVTDDNIKFYVEPVLDIKLNLFEFKVRFKVKDEFFDLDFIKELMQKSRKYVQLKDGATVNIENIREINKWIEFLKMFVFSKAKDAYTGTLESALELDRFLEDFKDKDVRSNEEYKRIILELKDKKPVDKIELPSEVNNILRSYQKEGVYWLYFLKKYGFGGILADEMGLGKTLQALTILAMEKEGVSIVICPKTLIYNWENEINKYFPKKKVIVIDGDNDKRKRLIQNISSYEIVITSYSMLQKDYDVYLEEDYEFNYSVLDEAHYVKNIKTLSAKAVRLIRSKNRILLTGTPLENNLSELFGTFDLIMPGYLGTRSDFTKDFVSKIERNNMIALDILQAKIRPFILRRTKKEVLKELPDKQEKIVYSEMTNKQIAIYNEVLNRVKGEINELVQLQGFDKSRIQILSALLKLRQICNHPALVDDVFRQEDEISGKFDQFLELLMQVIDSDEKVLVFSQFTSMLDIFEKELKKLGVSFLRLDGSTKNRQELVDKFNEDPTVSVFLISLKAGGVGLNLTSASAVFLYDPWWNPMVEQQAQDRAHRLGQKNTVNVYKFISKNSIEEKILKLQERKGNLFDNLVEEDKGFIKRLEWEDLMELFE